MPIQPWPLTIGITRIWEPHVIRVMQCNIRHVRGRDRDLLIDTGPRHRLSALRFVPAFDGPWQSTPGLAAARFRCAKRCYYYLQHQFAGTSDDVGGKHSGCYCGMMFACRATSCQRPRRFIHIPVKRSCSVFPALGIFPPHTTVSLPAVITVSP